MLEIPDDIEISLAIGLGYPDQESETENLKGSTSYWRDSKGNFHVPKRELEKILYKNKYS